MDELTASEALYGFCGWLISRQEKTVMSSTDDASPIPPLIERFCNGNALDPHEMDVTTTLSIPVGNVVDHQYECPNHAMHADTRHALAF